MWHRLHCRRLPFASSRAVRGKDGRWIGDSTHTAPSIVRAEKGCGHGPGKRPFVPVASSTDPARHEAAAEGHDLSSERWFTNLAQPHRCRSANLPPEGTSCRATPIVRAFPFGHPSPWDCAAGRTTDRPSAEGRPDRRLISRPSHPLIARPSDRSNIRRNAGPADRLTVRSFDRPTRRPTDRPAALATRLIARPFYPRACSRAADADAATARPRHGWPGS